MKRHGVIRKILALVGEGSVGSRMTEEGGRIEKWMRNEGEGSRALPRT